MPLKIDVFVGVPVDELTLSVKGSEALADIREADLSYRSGDVVRGVDAVRRLKK